MQVKIVGFDRASDFIGIEVEVPPAHPDRVRQIAAVPPGDPDTLVAYPLDDSQVASIADAARIKIDAARFVYFLEAYDERYQSGLRSTLRPRRPVPPYAGVAIGA